MLSLFLGENVAQFKFTVLLMPNGPHRITGLPFDTEICESDKKIEDLDIQVSRNFYVCLDDWIALLLKGSMSVENHGVRYKDDWCYSDFFN